MYIHLEGDKMKNKKYHTVEILPKSNIKIVERGKTIPPSTHTCSLSYPLQALE